jgi:hypothetical protein
MNLEEGAVISVLVRDVRGRTREILHFVQDDNGGVEQHRYNRSPKGTFDMYSELRNG